MGEDDLEREDVGLIVELGPVTVDVPRTIGYYAAIGAAVALDLIAPPLGLFIAAVPFIKLMKRKRASLPERAIAAIIEGAAKPVGGDAEAVVRPTWLEEEKEKKTQERSTPRAGQSGDLHASR